MKSWLISIAVVSVLSSIADMLLPATHVSRYAKLCISLLLTLVIIKPLTGLCNNEFKLSFPELEQQVDIDQNIFVDSEFSQRLTEAMKKDTGYENISLDAKLGYDSVLSVQVKGASLHQQEKINSVLSDKYNIPVEKVTYGTD